MLLPTSYPGSPPVGIQLCQITCVRPQGGRVSQNIRQSPVSDHLCQTSRPSLVSRLPASDQSASACVRPPVSDQSATTCVRPLGGQVGRTIRQSNPCQTSCVKPVSGRLPGTLFAPIFLWNGCCNNEFLLMLVAAMTQVRGKQKQKQNQSGPQSEHVDAGTVSKSMSF